MRTGLVALAIGVGAKATLKDVMPEAMIVATGTVLVLFSGFCFAVTVMRQMRLVINGFLVLVAAAALVGIWFGRTGSA